MTLKSLLDLSRSFPLLETFLSWGSEGIGFNFHQASQDYYKDARGKRDFRYQQSSFNTFYIQTTWLPKCKVIRHLNSGHFPHSPGHLALHFQWKDKCILDDLITLKKQYAVSSEFLKLKTFHWGFLWGCFFVLFSFFFWWKGRLNFLWKAIYF